MRRLTARLIAMLTGPILATAMATALPATAWAQPGCADTGTCAGQIAMNGGQLTRDGHPWIMRGMGISAMVLPPRHAEAAFARPPMRFAYNNYGPQLIGQIKAFGADTVVIKVSQPGLDPANALFDPAYAPRIAKAVRMFRESGLTVMVSVKWTLGDATSDDPGFPDASTEAAWATLLKVLPRADAGLMIDLFNEPKGQADPATWQAWQSEHDRLIAQVRQAGFRRQVVIVSGLRGSHILEGSPPITDPENRVVFGIHPYFNSRELKFGQPVNWEIYFGHFCASHQCLATEWTVNRMPNGNNIGCAGDARTISYQLLPYLWRLRMGIAGWSYDYPDTMMQSPDLARPTTFDAWAGTCKDSQVPFGPGQMLTDWFHSHAR